jgi:hypothetical protein
VWDPAKKVFGLDGNFVIKNALKVEYQFSPQKISKIALYGS